MPLRIPTAQQLLLQSTIKVLHVESLLVESLVWLQTCTYLTSLWNCAPKSLAPLKFLIPHQ